VMSAATRRGLSIFALMAAGETVFLLPFVLVRIFRPTFLDVFGVTNLQLGTAFSLYGIVAMLAYFAGGPLADRFSARRLMTVALVATGLGGIALAGVPPLGVLTLLYAFWGMTTILLFWSALIRAAREWGGSGKQGKAYGYLDGGRGLLAAVLASASVAIFAMLLPTDVASATPEQQAAAFRWIIWVFTGLTFAIALLVWVAVPESEGTAGTGAQPKLTLEGVRGAAKMPVVWLQAVIVVCAYVGYKVTDDFSLFARDALGYDEVAAATLGTVTFWVRPFAAVAAGLLGDVVDSSRVILWGFVLLILGCAAIAMGILRPDAGWVIVATIITTSVGIYALRGVYFALLAEGAVPLAVTGSAVGLVSVIGYTPDVFMGPLMGYLIDESPGALGHQQVFAVVAGFGVVGWIATIAFRRITARTAEATP
jgi:MFS family permease